jgi:hypothetical protein
MGNNKIMLLVSLKKPEKLTEDDEKRRAQSRNIL